MWCGPSGLRFNLAPLFAGRGRIALAIRVRGEALRSLQAQHSLIGEPLTPTLSPQERGEGETTHAEVDASGRTRSAPRRPIAVPRKIPATATNEASASVDRPVRPWPTEQPSAATPPTPISAAPETERSMCCGEL